MRHFQFVCCCVPVVALLPAVTLAQFGTVETATGKPSRTAVKHWKVGLTVEAVGGPCQGLYGTLPIPTDWPEQTVKVVDEEISGTVRKVQYRILGYGVKQMQVSIPRLANGETARAIVTVEIERREIPAPTETALLVRPKRPSRQIRVYLGSSPYIEVRHKEIRTLAKELADADLTAWEQTEKIYDHVRAVVKYKNGPLKGALTALRDGTGDCEELTSLFIALCRVNGVPARTVWVPDHCYPEFYLEDAEDKGNWYPCQAAGDRAFGTMPDLRPILQKGDSFKVPEKKKRQRYVSEHLTGSKKINSGRPKVNFIRQEFEPSS